MQAVVISVSYADLLYHTLPTNVPQFDKLVVVTESWDKDTIDLCKFYDVEYVVAEGNKGEKINAGLARLNKSDWVVQLDADIWLPPQTVRILKRKDLDKETLYGIDRAMCWSYNDFAKFLQGADPVYPEKFFTVPAFPIGARVVQHYGIGYIPIGYFQLWHPLGSGVFSYPTKHDKDGIYARTDVAHAWRFPKRALAAEVLAIHLEEGVNAMGANWNGRTTPIFGPFKPNTTKASSNDYEN